MWYFSAILGLFLVSFFAILNAMWIELDYDDNGNRRSRQDEDDSAEDNTPVGGDQAGDSGSRQSASIL